MQWAKHRPPSRVAAAAVFLHVLAAITARAEDRPIITFAPGGGPAIVVLANRDDDDGDGVPDSDDEQVNGPADEPDLAPLVLLMADPRVARVRVSSGGAPLRFFSSTAAGWRHEGLADAVVTVPRDSPGDGKGATVTLFVEACAWAGLPAEWDGAARIKIEAVDDENKSLGVAHAECRVAPVLLRPATAPVREVFVASGHYGNEAFVAALRGALEPLAVPLTVCPAAEWREMWMQDTMEIATASISGSRMHVVLAGLRGADTFPPTLLGPDTAVAEVAKPRNLTGGDAWADWYGNLEVSPAVPQQPHGRAIYGNNVLTGESFHPDMVRFLAAQREQDPLWIDTSWLVIKHVDEIVAFLPGPDGRGVLLVPDPEEGLRLAGTLKSADGAADAVLANRRIAAIIDKMLAGGAGPARAGAFSAAAAGSPASGLLALLGWDRTRIVRLPLAFRVPADGLGADGSVTGATALWSNPVNALSVNGTVICGSCDMPEPVRQVCQDRFRAAGAGDVVFLDDAPYHRRSGNVHCATNACRE